MDGRERPWGRAMAKCGCRDFAGARGITGRFKRRDLGGSFARPHAVVGLFIVNNRPETMARSFLQPNPRMTGALAPGRSRDMRPRSKKPGAVSRPGGWRSFGEYAFLEDS